MKIYKFVTWITGVLCCVYGVFRHDMSASVMQDPRIIGLLFLLASGMFEAANDFIKRRKAKKRSAKKSGGAFYNGF